MSISVAEDLPENICYIKISLTEDLYDNISCRVFTGEYLWRSVYMSISLAEGLPVNISGGGFT